MRLRLYVRYLMRRTLVGIAGLFLVIGALIVTVDLIEALREVGKIEGAGFLTALRLTLLRAPQVLLTLSPFVFLFGTLFAFGQMAKSSEIAVMRAAGVSVWRLVVPGAALAVILGFATVTALDPLAARMESSAQALKNEVRGRDGKMLAAFREGIWLRQREEGITMVIHAARFDPADSMLHDVTIWKRTREGTFLERWDAKTAAVTEDAFVLAQARRTATGLRRADERALYVLPVGLDLRALREDKAKPDALSVWELPDMTRVLESAGLSTISYRLRYHDLWSLPLKLAAMVLIACAFSVSGNARQGGIARLMGVGVAAGFVLFIVSELSAATAEASIVPVALAAWAPAILAILAATSLLLFREDG
ncbi:LPS export ABC transporter permease LptG [Parvularcula dongshanensis]|uniref:Lipopolysaccharide export system permease protein n=1 Tax=Parvularcula dongshanensis TaxID=1173995 RepID=A0A840I6Y2_9PROT|nr:LPS export ABC transporter permease LptG [Parvularcula dongshanensis]MBB4660075.1 lipopolysaccharide export system permease protein [Parvularcula dongshanensis]